MAVKTHQSLLNAGQSIVAEEVTELDFYPSSGNLYPKFPDKFKRTAVEVWLFDALAEDGSAVFTVSFLRDSLAAPAGFRVGMNASWADGTNWSSQLVLPDSNITLEGPTLDHGHVRGVWKGSNSHAEFDVAENLSHATVSFEAPGTITGTLTLKSLDYNSLPRTADEAKASSELFWMRPVAMADATLDVTITTDSGEKRMQISKENGGYGGIDRSWDGKPWTKAVTDSLFARAKVGPYVLQVMRLVGRPEKNYEITGNARLYRDGTLVCAPQQVLKDVDSAASATEDALVVTKRFDENGVAATFRDKNTGYDIEFVSTEGQALQRWRFEMKHDRVWWRKPTSAPGPNATGSSAFVAEITGGLADASEQFQGWGMDGQVEMPE